MRVRAFDGACDHPASPLRLRDPDSAGSSARPRSRVCAALAAAVSFTLALHGFVRPAEALIIESGDGSGNTEAPSDDPGWDNLAAMGPSTAVYLGNRWLITAGHLGLNDVEIAGQIYARVPNSRVLLADDDGRPADLALFRIDRDPPVPALRIAAATPPEGTPLILIGRGLGRGQRLWSGLRSGFRWGPEAPMRWGTNRVQSVEDRIRGTDAFTVRFSIAGSEHEAIAARGDSGGAAFARGRDGWELAGILIAVDSLPAQPAMSALYGNRTHIADLSTYRSRILEIVRGSYSRLPPSRR